MSQISYDEYENSKQPQKPTSRIAFFSLKNDKDEAIVRIMHSSVEDFDINSIHKMKVNNRFGSYNCLRSPDEPIDKCPFCANNIPIARKIYIHLLEYTKDQNSKIIVTPKVWERPTGYVTTLKNLLMEYGPLPDNIFKIKRNGQAGSVDTTYDIMYANPNLYPASLYVKDEQAFANIKALGTVIIDKSYEEAYKMMNQPAAAPTDQKQEPEPASDPFTPQEPAPTRTYQAFNTTDSFERPKRLC